MAGSTRFIVDDETFQVLETLSAETQSDLIKMSANAVALNQILK